jgi:phosphoribosylanthranilate isomerase
MTLVKICGLKVVGDVQAAVDSGANAVGFIFAKSRRQISLQQAKELAILVPIGILKVGVFVNETKEMVEKFAREVPLDIIQLHGDESPEYVKGLPIPVIKAFSITDERDVQRALEFDVDYYLFDTPGVEFRGGSGHSFDWTLVEKAGIPTEKIILAGGLHAGNVQQAIQMVQPFMVDVSSGVETDKRKDAKKIRVFVSAVRDEER